MKKSPSYVTNATFKKETAAIRADIKGLHRKIDSSVARQDNKIDSAVARLDQKIDLSVAQLDQKIDSSVAQLDQKIDLSVAQLDQKIDSSVARLNEKIDSSVARLDQKIDSSVNRLDKKIDGLSLSLVGTNQRITELEKRMATKDDMNRLFGLIDDLSKKTSLVLQNQEIHRGYLHDHELRLTALEKRAAG